MADPSIDLQPIPLDRPAVNQEAGYHEFVPSEFAPTSGRCDRCGGGELAAIHKMPVDNVARIARALEEIAGALHRIEDRFRETRPTEAEALAKLKKERNL